MNKYFCISVTLMDPLFHGEADGGEPEWPPSPFRLFQALIAGARGGCRNPLWSEEKARAFSWLEQQNPPLIIAPQARLAPAITLFVPNNDSNMQLERNNRLTGKTVQPHRLLDGQTIHYLWTLPESDDPSVRQFVNLLCAESRQILTFGWGIDMACGNGRILDEQEAAALSGVRWRPWRRNHTQTNQLKRVPKPGSLQNLEAVYETFIHSVKGKIYNPPLKPVRYDRICYLSDESPPPRPYAVFEIRNADDHWVALPHENVVFAAAMLRSLLCRNEGDIRNRDDFAARFPEINPEVYLAGHANGARDTPPRFSYLPLPSIVHRHADGFIRRLMIAEPYGGDGKCVEWVKRCLYGQELTDPANRSRGILFPMRTIDSVAGAFVKSTSEWASVTPVLLPGYDDGRREKADKLFLQAVQQAGLKVESIAEFNLRKAPYHPGSLHPRQYHRPDYLKKCPAWRAWIRFRDPLTGPLALGAGRHCGLGIFAAAPK